MPHRSRLSYILIDCPAEKMDAGIAFWSGALNLRPSGKRPDDANPYAMLEGKSGDMHIGLQRIDEPARIHLDIETDDVDAEVRRLEALGARLVERQDGWCIMQAPSGHLLCVFPSQSADFPAGANTWDE